MAIVGTMGFLLARADRVLRATGVRTRFDSVAAAARALETGATEIVVGALPFDPNRPAALLSPADFAFTDGPLHPQLAPLPTTRLVREIPTQAEHVERVTKLVKLIGEGALRKVVAARSVALEADAAIDPELLVAHLISRHPTSNGFVADIGTGTLVGASPELLVSRRGNRVTLRPLAGTAPRRSHPDADRAEADKLLASTKDQEEHSYVTEWIKAKLSTICSELIIPSAPVLTDTPEVWHLATPIEGRAASSDAGGLRHTDGPRAGDNPRTRRRPRVLRRRGRLVRPKRRRRMDCRHPMCRDFTRRSDRDRLRRRRHRRGFGPGRRACRDLNQAAYVARRARGPNLIRRGVIP